MHVYVTFRPCWLTLPRATLKSGFQEEVFFLFLCCCLPFSFSTSQTSGVCVATCTFHPWGGTGDGADWWRQGAFLLCAVVPSTCLVWEMCTPPLFPLEMQVESWWFAPFGWHDQENAINLKVTPQTMCQGLLMTRRWQEPLALFGSQQSTFAWVAFQ